MRTAWMARGALAAGLLMVGAGLVVGLGAATGLAMPAMPPNPTPTPTPSPVKVSVHVEPASTVPGGQVRVIGYCPTAKNATAESPAFGVVAMLPAASGGSLYAQVTIPSTTAVGTYPVQMKCGDGNGQAQTQLVVTAAPSSGPPTGGGSTAPGGGVAVLAGSVALVGCGGMLLAWSLRRRART